MGGCGSTQSQDTNGGAKPVKPGQKHMITETDRGLQVEADPKYLAAVQGFSDIFVVLGKEKQQLAGIVVDNIDVTIAILTPSGELFANSFDHVVLTEMKSEKSSWSAFFKQLKSQTKKATYKRKGDKHRLAIPADGKSTGALDIPLNAEGSDGAKIHRVLLQPMVRAFAKFKAGDDSKVTNMEIQSNAKAASTAECMQKLSALQSEIGPLKEHDENIQADAKAAREQCDGIRKRISRLRCSLDSRGGDHQYPDGPVIYSLHLPQGRAHYPQKKPGNPQLMAKIREKFNGDTSISVEAGGESPDASLKLLEKIDDWDFDVFALSKATNGTPLFTTGYYLLHKYGLVQHFNIDHTVLCNFLQAVEAGYQPNPYHNGTHGADVCQMTHYIMESGNLKETISMTENDQIACILAALIHDFDHPGFNNNFHIRTGSYLATLFNDRSVLENHHCTSIFEMTRNPKYNIFASMSWEQYKDIRDTMLEMVLSTDMGLHAKIYQTFRRRQAEDKEWAGKEDVRLAMSVALKMADISNCCRPREIYQDWAKCIAAEFYNQGDAEARLGLSISPFMDRRKDKQEFPKGQISFMNYIVIPLFEAGAQLLPKMAFAVDQARKNKQDLLNGAISS